MIEMRDRSPRWDHQVSYGYIDISQLIGYKFIIGLKELSAWKALISGYME